jgi:hypothetical protein
MMGRMKVQLETAAIFSAVIRRQKKSVKVKNRSENKLVF